MFVRLSLPVVFSCFQVLIIHLRYVCILSQLRGLFSMSTVCRIELHWSLKSTGNWETVFSELNKF